MTRRFLDIVEEVARAFGMDASDVLSRQRDEKKAEAQSVIARLAHERYGMNAGEIARELGRDRNTVVRLLEGKLPRVRTRFTRIEGAAPNAPKYHRTNGT